MLEMDSNGTEVATGMTLLLSGAIFMRAGISVTFSFLFSIRRTQE